MIYLIQLLLEKLELQYPGLSDLDNYFEGNKYDQIWGAYRARLNKRFTWLMIIFIGIPFIGLSFILFLIDYPEPVNIPGPFGWWK